MTRRDDAPRDLLFGLLALRDGMVDAPQLVAAFNAWTASPGRSLADLLAEHGGLTAARRDRLEARLAEHLAARVGEAGRGLTAPEADRSTHEGLSDSGPDAGATLAYVGSGAPAAVATASDGPRFRVLRPHAQGGLGAVFVALDAELNREVALKQILDHHADDPVSRSRFLIEAEITGGLEHPGIVPVYSLGTHDGGRPYYAMRFIRGDSLKEVADRFHADEALRTDPGRRSLERRKLLRRFLDVCNAIEYAHSRGVIHRDIKPRNIIVGNHGETLVVDWGLAKAVGRADPGADSGERMLILSSSSGSAGTLPGSTLGTPGYMSPEQAHGDLAGLGPWSDVYSLGATLYYLLTGRTPFQGNIYEMIGAVKRGDVRPPRRLDATIDPALEAVCLGAMAHRPADRYASARALADDIERWMADEPVSSWREPMARRARRWARRNRTAVTAAAVAMVALVVGLSAVLAVQTRARSAIAGALRREQAANEELVRSRAAVQARYDLAVEAIKTFHTGVSEDFLLKQDQFRELRNRLLKSAADFYGRLSALLGEETDAGSRRALAASNHELADLTARVGRKEEALAAHRSVLAAREAMAAGPGAGAAATMDVGRSLSAVARLLAATGKAAEALETYRRSESILTGPASADPGAREELAECRSRRGYLLTTLGRNAEALAVYRQARADQEALAAAPGAAKGARKGLADTLIRIGLLLREMGRPGEAEGEFRAAIAIYRKLVEEDPAAADSRNRLALSHTNLGILLQTTSRPDRAEAEYRAAIALQRKLAEDYPAATDSRSSLANSHTNLGTLLAQTGRPRAAEAEFRAAIAIDRKLVEEDPAATPFRSRLANSHFNLGNLLRTTSRLREAEAELRVAIALQRGLVEAGPALTDSRSRLANSHTNLGTLLMRSGRLTEAEAEVRDAIALLRDLAENSPTVTAFRSSLANSHTHLGTLLAQTGRPAEAEAAFRAAIALHRELAEGHPAVTAFRSRLALSRNGLGWLLAQAGRLGEAEAEYRQALALFLKLADENPKVPFDRDQAANAGNNLSVVLRRLGRPAEARDLCERAVAIREALVRDRPETPAFRAGLAENCLNRGLARRALGDPAGAVADLRRAAALYESLRSLHGENWFLFATARAALAGLAGQPGSGVSADEAAGEADAAMALLRKAVAMGYRTVDPYRSDDALDPIRDRDDFRMLVMDLAFPADPFAEGR